MLIPYVKYLRTDLLRDEKLVEWLAMPRIRFDLFLFYEPPESEQWESIGKDYFKIVFRPVTHSEWETFSNSKTANLTRAVAVMLANCKGSAAADTLFEAMCRQTLT
jgi:hypothetical protein